MSLLCSSATKFGKHSRSKCSSSAEVKQHRVKVRSASALKPRLIVLGIIQVYCSQSMQWGKGVVVMQTAAKFGKHSRKKCSFGA